MRVSIVGTGYVGLVTGVCLAERGHDVICVDVDPRKVDMINAAEAPRPRSTKMDCPNYCSVTPARGCALPRTWRRPWRPPS